MNKTSFLGIQEHTGHLVLSMTPILSLIYAISHAVATLVRLAVLTIVGALYAYSFPAIIIMEFIGLVILVTIGSFFIDQDELKDRLDDGLIAFSGAVLIEDMWYYLIRRRAPRHINKYKDFFKHSIEPEILPFATPVFSVILSTALYLWAFNGGLESVWFYIVIFSLSIALAAVTEGGKFLSD